MHIYFLHDTLTPENVRASMEAEAVPPIGAVVRLPDAGQDGGETWWRIVDQEWKWVPPVPGHFNPVVRAGYWSVTVRCTTDV